MSDTNTIFPTDPSRRTWLAISCATGAVGTAAIAVPFISSFGPSEKAKAAGAPVEADISALKEGEFMTVEWRGKPVWIMRRTKEQVEELAKLDPLLADPNSERTNFAATPEYAKNTWRSIKPEFFIGVGICPHLGCSPTARFATGAQPSLPDNWEGGYLCPCHGSTFDLAGRVFKDKPSPDNLEVPPHKYVSDTKVLIGDDSKA